MFFILPTYVAFCSVFTIIFLLRETSLTDLDEIKMGKVSVVYFFNQWKEGNWKNYI
jgi:hypothetical protein